MSATAVDQPGGTFTFYPGGHVHTGSPIFTGSPIDLALSDPAAGGSVVVAIAGVPADAASSANVGGFSGTVAGLGTGGATNATDIAFGGSDTLANSASAAGTGGTPMVSDGAPSANLALLGQYAAAEFATAPDPGGGTVVNYGQAPPASSSTDQTPLAPPHH